MSGGCLCGCCECAHTVTPVAVANRPGLSWVAIRPGTHSTFLESMTAALSSTEVPSAGALTTREPSDAAMAMLDAWATVADVLTFYEERVANEGYLRTATERRSIVELGRLVGYELRPGVAASVFLAYTLQENDTIEIPRGSKVQSVPAIQGEKPQVFETSDPLSASWKWNAMAPRPTRHPVLTMGNVYTIDHIDFAGTSTNLKPQDSLLFVFGRGFNEQVVRVVQSVTADSASARTVVTLQPFDSRAVKALAALEDARNTLLTAGSSFAEWFIAAERWMNVYGGAVPAALVTAYAEAFMTALVTAATDPSSLEPIAGFFKEFRAIFDAGASTGSTGGGTPSADIYDVITELKAAPNAQLRSGKELPRDLEWLKNDAAESRFQMMRSVFPRLRIFGDALGSTVLQPPQQALPDVYVLREVAATFGSLASKYVPATASDQLPVERTTVEPEDDISFRLDLDRVYDHVQPNSWIVVRPPIAVRLYSESSFHNASMVAEKPQPSQWLFGAKPLFAESAETVSRSGYDLSVRVTRLTMFDRRTGAADTVASLPWWQEPENKSNTVTLGTLRATTVLVQAEALEIADEVIEDDVAGKVIVLDGYYAGLQSGQWIVVTGERTDIPNTRGVVDSEVVMIAAVEQRDAPGDTKHTVLQLAGDGLAHRYRRPTVVINANVVKATHGETVEEIAGSGDASKTMQQMTLKHAPLTFVSAPTPSGIASTLEVRVNRVRWDETESFSGLDSAAHAYMTKISDEGVTTAIFPNGVEGSRLPTGIDNVTARYRVGLGRAGNVKAGQLTQALTKPLGTKAVVNPLAATGGADPESRDQARRNIPVAVLALDRLVSVSDYADFTRTFAGIAKASAVMLPGDGFPIVHVTIAADGDGEIDTNSDLYKNLVAALQTNGDAYQHILVEPREQIIALLRANVRVDSHYLWADVEPAIRIALLDRFGFENRNLGDNLYESEITAVIQSVPGVDYVDVDLLRSIAAGDVIPRNGQVVLHKSIAEHDVPFRFISARLAWRDGEGVIHPAQLAYLTPDVPDTVVLQEITEA